MTITSTTSNTATRKYFTVEMVRGGFILSSPDIDDVQRSEVFVSVSKLNKAVRQLVEDFSLIPKKASDGSED